MPDAASPCPHRPSVAGAGVTCTAPEGMAALAWQADALPVLRELLADMDAAATAGPTRLGRWRETVQGLLAAIETEGD